GKNGIVRRNPLERVGVRTFRHPGPDQLVPGRAPKGVDKSSGRFRPEGYIREEPDGVRYLQVLQQNVVGRAQNLIVISTDVAWQFQRMLQETSDLIVIRIGVLGRICQSMLGGGVALVVYRQGSSRCRLGGLFESWRSFGQPWLLDGSRLHPVRRVR